MTESKKIDGTPWRELDYSEVLQAVKNGNNRAKTKLAWLMLAGLGDKGDGEDEAVALLEERAKDNDLDALWMLALCNEYGIGTEKDLSRAACLNRQSRKKGSALAQLLHHCGSGVLLITDKESCQELEKVLPIVRWTTVVLSFENNRDECTKKVCELLKTNTTVTELNMQWNDYWKDRKSVSEMLMVNTTLTKVDMTGNRSFGASDLSWLCRPLATNSSLTTLDLSRSWIDPERVEMLSESLKTNTTLTELYLSSNSIGDEGACKISELLMVNATLVKLMLEGIRWTQMKS